MATRGTKESEQLRKNVEDQLNRLLQQLQDLEEMKDDMEESEYTSSKEDTLQQMKEFEQTLDRLISGDVTLVSQLDSMRNAVKAYVTGACRDPNITKMFANKSTAGLRSKLSSLEQDLKLGRITDDAFNSLAVEIVASLEKLGEGLSPQEVSILEKSRRNLEGFTLAEGEIGMHVLEAAGKKK